MDEETKHFLDAMEARLTAQIHDNSEGLEARLTAQIHDNSEGLEARFTARMDALLARMNNQYERILNDLTGLRSDFVNTREFLLHDSAVRGRQWLDLEARVAKLENKNG